MLSAYWCSSYRISARYASLPLTPSSSHHPHLNASPYYRFTHIHPHLLHYSSSLFTLTPLSISITPLWGLSPNFAYLSQNSTHTHSHKHIHALPLHSFLSLSSLLRRLVNIPHAHRSNAPKGKCLPLLFSTLIHSLFVISCSTP